LHFVKAITATLTVLTVLSLMGCGGNSSAVQSGSVTITTQPANQAVPIGRTATFTVVADLNPATAPALTYQWTKNGAEIPGATASSYTTPTVSSADNGTKYQVTVSSGSDSLTSNRAALTAGPRAPAIGDVRYLLWEQAGPRNSNAQIGVGEFGLGTYASINNALGTPLSMWDNAADCYWGFNYLVVPMSMNGQYTTYYEQDGNFQEQSWQSYLESLNSPNIVIISADLVANTCEEIGVAYLQVQAGGFNYKQEEVAASALAATVAADGAASRIVTTVTFDDTQSPPQVVVISYGWQGDTTTVYESQALSITPNTNNIGSAAQTLANDGYFISAFGGNYTDGWYLVGMRVQGDSMPRPISLGSGEVNTTTTDNAYWSVVATLNDGLFIAEQ
jgi:hypothetical protein